MPERAGGLFRGKFCLPVAEIVLKITMAAIKWRPDRGRIKFKKTLTIIFIRLISYLISVCPKNTSFEKISDEKFQPGNNFYNEQGKYIYKIDSAHRNY